MNTEQRYDEERLGELLQMLRPAPEAWVRRAQEIPLGPPLDDSNVAELARRLETDEGFRKRFDADPVAATEFAGLSELSAQLRREMQELVAFAERITSDSAYREQLAHDPYTALVAAGMPGEAAEPLLRTFDLPEDVLEKVEVCAHRQEGPGLLVLFRLGLGFVRRNLLGETLEVLGRGEPGLAQQLLVQRLVVAAEPAHGRESKLDRGAGRDDDESLARPRARRPRAVRRLRRRPGPAAGG